MSKFIKFKDDIYNVSLIEQVNVIFEKDGTTIHKIVFVMKNEKEFQLKGNGVDYLEIAFNCFLRDSSYLIDLEFEKEEGERIDNEFK